MQYTVWMTGLVLAVQAIGEYDRRVTILSKERGKITVFAKGARRPTSQWVGTALPFSFGRFKLYGGSSSYRLIEMDLQQSFGGLRTDLEASLFGM